MSLRNSGESMQVVKEFSNIGVVRNERKFMF